MVLRKVMIKVREMEGVHVGFGISGFRVRVFGVLFFSLIY